MILARTFAKDVAWQYSATASTILAEFMTIWFVANSLGSTAVGAISFGYSFSFVINQLFDVRSTEIVIKFLTQSVYRSSASESISVIWASFATEFGLRFSALVTGIAIAFAGANIGYLERPTLVVLCLSLVYVFFGTMFMGPARGVFRVLNCFRTQAFVAIFAAFLKVLSVLLVLYQLNPTVDHVIVAILLASIVTPVLLIACTYRCILAKFSPKSVLRLSFYEVRSSLNLPEVLSFAKYQYFSTLMMIPTKEMDIGILAGISDLQTVGFYKLAKNIASAINSVPDAVFMASYPVLTKYVEAKHFKEMWEFVRKLTWFLLVGSTVGVLVACIVYPHVVSFVFGDEFRASTGYFRILAIGIIFWAPLVWFNPLLLAAGRADVIAKGAFLGSLMVLMTCLGASHCFGAIGIAIAMALSTPIVFACIFALAKREKVFEAISASTPFEGDGKSV